MPKVRVLTQYCKGCGLCIPVCARKALYLSNEVNKRGLRVAEVHKEVVCNGCTFCATVCPDAAIEVDD